MIAIIVTALSAIMWLAILLLPWRPWSTREFLEADASHRPEDLSDITVLVPARNEADHIAEVIASLAAQGDGLQIVLVDDQSTDETAARAANAGCSALSVVAGSELPEGWSGKLWALEQGRRLVRTPLTLLLDADIVLAPGMLRALRRRLRQDGVQLASLMVHLRMVCWWERLCMPAFVYFFKLMYPFRLSNSPSRRVAAAAGGCILLETRVLEEIGGFGALRGAIIDDCALAWQVKSRGNKTWIGLTRSARSLRRYERLADIWDMVARTAYTQLGYAAWRLLACTLLMALVYGVPVWGLLWGGSAPVRTCAAVALCVMCATYLPTLRFYGLRPGWVTTLPLSATLFLCMTWSSAIRYWRGSRSSWKGRVYKT